MAGEPLTADSIIVRVIAGDITPSQLEAGADEAFAEAQRVYEECQKALGDCERARGAYLAAVALLEVEREHYQAAWDVYQAWRQAEKRLAEAGRRAAGNPLIQELMQTTGQDRRERELKEQKVALENHINIKLEMDERAIASAWERQVMPAFDRIIRQVKQEMENRINELENRRLTEGRRTFPQF